MDISENLNVPCEKPDIEQFISLFSKVTIISHRVVKTPITDLENKEGTLLTGRKLVIEGILRQKIVYTADVPSQSVHSVHFDIPFSAFVIIQGTAIGSDRFKVEPYIEDIYIYVQLIKDKYLKIQHYLSKLAQYVVRRRKFISFVHVEIINQ